MNLFHELILIFIWNKFEKWSMIFQFIIECFTIYLKKNLKFKQVVKYENLNEVRNT